VKPNPSLERGPPPAWRREALAVYDPLRGAIPAVPLSSNVRRHARPALKSLGEWVASWGSSAGTERGRTSRCERESNPSPRTSACPSERRSRAMSALTPARCTDPREPASPPCSPVARQTSRGIRVPTRRSPREQRRRRARGSEHYAYCGPPGGVHRVGGATAPGPLPPRSWGAPVRLVRATRMDG
jgi:hypothetical protein